MKDKRYAIWRRTDAKGHKFLGAFDTEEKAKLLAETLKRMEDVNGKTEKR